MKEMKLEEGENVFTIRASNRAGQVAAVTKTITFSVEGPTLVVGYAPETTTTPTPTDPVPNPTPDSGTGDGSTPAV